VKKQPQTIDLRGL